ncbi:MAG TPA: hypothetical protein VFF67_10710 [Thermoplasmata archaeon]|nr:hypothetical protein [Thermoplasmata archaeon]
MTSRPTAGRISPAFDRLVADLTKLPGVSQPTRRGFGNAALWAGHRMFAFLDARGSFVVKLPATRVDALVAEGRGVRWVPGRGRSMREWVALDGAHAGSWLDLAIDARAFVAEGKSSKLRSGAIATRSARAKRNPAKRTR